MRRALEQLREPREAAEGPKPDQPTVRPKPDQATARPEPDQATARPKPDQATGQSEPDQSAAEPEHGHPRVQQEPRQAVELKPARIDAGRRPGADNGKHGAGLPPDGPQDPDLSYWQQVERFHAIRECRFERRPDTSDRSRRDHTRPGDPPASWRGDGERYLTPDQNAEADRVIVELWGPEQSVTGILKQIQLDNPHGGRLEGLPFRLKGADRLKEKIADKIGVKPGISIAEAAGSINDAVRYTFAFHRDVYVTGYGDARQRLEASGCVENHRRNRWLNDPHYKGINTCWETPDGGRFEVQFHTFESYHAKSQLTRPAYERLRTPTTSRPERRALNAFQREVCAAIPEPAAIASLTDYERVR